MGHPWNNAVDSDTDVALSSNRHGVGAGGTWNVPGRRAFGLVTQKRKAIMHGRSSREGWARARGARGRRRLGRDCGDVCSVRESRTITLKVRRRASAGHSRVQGGESGLRRRVVYGSPELLP